MSDERETPEMSDEGKNRSGTEVPLREHIGVQLKWIDRHFETQITAIQTATRIALDTLNSRLEGMNEFRAALKDQVATFANKDETERRLGELETSKAWGEGRAAAFGLVGGLVASLFIDLILLIVFYVFLR